MLRPYQQINRRKSRVIKVGNVSIGGNNQIAVQTMTNTLTSNAKDTIAQMSIDRIELLFNAWSDRYINLMKRDDIEYVMPFENRGIECGVTLHHPHGQIYAYPIIPPVIQKEIEAFSKENFIEKLMKNLEKKIVIQMYYLSHLIL